MRNNTIGFIFQSYNLINRTTIIKNVEFPGITGGMSDVDRRRRALKLLNFLGIGDKAKYKPSNLSGGQQQRVPGSSIQANNPTGLLVGDSIANPPGLTTPFVTVGQTVKATYSFADPTTGKLQTASRSFVVTGVMQPTGNNQIDKAVIINEATANSLFHKAGKYDSMNVAALSPDYVNAVQQEITNIYGSNNIGVTTPKAILQTRQQFQSGNSSFILDIAFISLLVGAVGIITTLYTSVNERKRRLEP